MTPRTQALAFRIWSYAEPRGWDCTTTEIAEALDESMPRVRATIALKPGWGQRLRVTMTDRSQYGTAAYGRTLGFVADDYFGGAL